jgi:glycerol-3-phosphate acyltransferase PlsY
MSGNLAVVVLVLLVLIVPALAFRRGAMISSDMIRAEFFSDVEKSAASNSSTNVVRHKRAGSSSLAFACDCERCDIASHTMVADETKCQHKSWRKSAAVKGNSFEDQAFLERGPSPAW